MRNWCELCKGCGVLGRFWSRSTCGRCKGSGLEPAHTWEPAPAGRPRVSFGVGVLVVKDNSFLVTRRKPGCGSGVGVVCLPGGSIEFGETVAEAAVREVREETGLDVRLVDGRVFHVGERIADGEHHVSLFVLAWHVDDVPVNLEPEKHEEWWWTRSSEIEGPTWVPADVIQAEFDL